MDVDLNVEQSKLWKIKINTTLIITSIRKKWTKCANATRKEHLSLGISPSGRFLNCILITKFSLD